MTAAVPVGVVAHAVHYTLLAGGLVTVATLLWSTRPSTGAAPRRDHDRRVVELRQAVRAGTLGVRTLPPLGAGPAAEAAARHDLPWGRLAATGSAGAAAVHAAATPVHVEEGLLLGTFFVAATLGQLAWAVLALRRPRRWLWPAGAVGNALVVLLWVVTRTLGLPFGLLDGPEPVGGWDVAASVFEVVVVLGCWVELGRSGRAELAEAGGEPSGEWTTLARAWLLVVVAVVAVLTVTGLPT